MAGKTLDIRQLVSETLPERLEGVLAKAGYEIDDCQIRFPGIASKKQIADHIAHLIKPLILQSIKNG